MRKIVLVLSVWLVLVGIVAAEQFPGVSDEFISMVRNNYTLIQWANPADDRTGRTLVLAHDAIYGQYDLQNARQRIEGSCVYIILKSKRPGSFTAKFYHNDVLLDTSLSYNFGTEKQEVAIPSLKLNRCNIILLN